jgi:serine kinase of HPr protein (carbohydrate metabolism regulator)
MMVVVTGASGSGKSEYAEGVAVKLAGKGDLLSCDDACLWRRGSTPCGTAQKTSRRERISNG